MASIIKSISLSPEHLDFCKENNMSLSGLLKQRIQEVMEFSKKSRVMRLQNALNVYIQKLDQANKKIEELENQKGM